MHPLVRRTWAPVGQTPKLFCRTRHHRKISGIGGISLSPCRRQVRLFLQVHSDRSIRQEQVIDFLRSLFKHLRGRVILVWDRLSAHRGALVKKYWAKHARVDREYFPPYAPELNPLEYAWSNLKGRSTLANACPGEVGELHGLVRKAANRVHRRPNLLRSLIRATKLPIRL